MAGSCKPRVSAYPPPGLVMGPPGVNRRGLLKGVPDLALVLQAGASSSGVRGSPVISRTGRTSCPPWRDHGP